MREYECRPMLHKSLTKEPDYDLFHSLMNREGWYRKAFFGYFSTQLPSGMYSKRSDQDGDALLKEVQAICNGMGFRADIEVIEVRGRWSNNLNTEIPTVASLKAAFAPKATIPTLSDLVDWQGSLGKITR